MSSEPPAINCTESSSAARRPCLSAYAPSSAAPRGRIKKPTAKMAASTRLPMEPEMMERSGEAAIAAKVAAGSGKVSGMLLRLRSVLKNGSCCTQLSISTASLDGLYRALEYRLIGFAPDGINQFIQQFSILHQHLFKAAFQHEAILFEHALRPNVGAKGPGKHAVDVVGLKRKRHGLPDGGADDALPPKRLGQPVAQLRVAPVNVVLRMNADAAHGLPIYLDGEDVHGVALRGKGDKAPASRLGIGKRKLIRHVLRHVPVVGVLDQASQVGNGPGPELEGGLHSNI
nr:hypothetical protein [Tanacetum cinerariifolium]